MAKTFTIKTYGCQMNHSDSERIAAVCEQIGLNEIDDERRADLLIFNTCSVKQAAEDKVLGLGRLAKDLKEKNPAMKIIITGCMVLRGTGPKHEQWQKTLKMRMPWADHFVPIKDMQNLEQYLGDWLKDGKGDINEYFAISPRYKSKFEAYVPISTGCDHYCTFCIVPFSRGREERRDAKSILNEVRNLIRNGYKDITLLGQIVNRWENPDRTSQIKTFADLIREIDTIDGDFWFTFLSSHPNYMNDDLIDAIVNSKHARPYFHFALQSGNDQMLARMNRRHTMDEFYTICEKLQKNVPNLNISTDIIVGFPGETKEQFLDTKAAMEKIEFDMAYISEFSPRTGTAAALMKDTIPQEVKKERKKILNDDVLAKTAFKKNESMVGQKVKVLVKRIQENGNVQAKTSNFKDIDVAVTENIQEGEFIDVLVENCTNWSLTGKII